MSVEDQLRKINTAARALRAFGKIDRKTAEQMLPMWSGYRHLSHLQVSEVLKRFR